MAAPVALPDLVEENLRGYVLLLSAHFQGFCRDLYTEAAQLIIADVPPHLQSIVQNQFSAHCKLDQGNPTLQNVRADFERLLFRLDLPSANPDNHVRLQLLADLVRWRNVAAHQGIIPPGAPLSLALLEAWRDACDGLAASLDGITYDELRQILGRQPWMP